MDQQIKQQFNNKDNIQGDNNKENHKDKKLTFIDFLRPEFLMGALLRKAKIPATASEFLAPIKVYFLLLLLVLIVLISVVGIQGSLQWLRERLSEAILAVILGFVVFRFIVKSWKK